MIHLSEEMLKHIDNMEESEKYNVLELMYKEDYYSWLEVMRGLKKLHKEKKEKTNGR